MQCVIGEVVQKLKKTINYTNILLIRISLYFLNNIHSKQADGCMEIVVVVVVTIVILNYLQCS